MTTQYFDGINNLHLQDGTVRGTFVVIESHFESSEENSTSGVKSTKVVPVVTMITSVRGALQIHAALDQLIKKLIENKVLHTADSTSAVLSPESLNIDKGFLN